MVGRILSQTGRYHHHPATKLDHEATIQTGTPHDFAAKISKQDVVIGHLNTKKYTFLR